MIPAAPLLVVLVLDGAPTTRADTRADVAHAIAADGRFTIAALDDAKLAVVLADRTEPACVSDACALELGARHGADFVLRVDEARVATEDVVALTALAKNTQTRASARIADAGLKREAVRALTRKVLDELALKASRPIAATQTADDSRVWLWRGGFIGSGVAAIGVGIALEMLPSATDAPEPGLVAPVIIGGGLLAIGVGVVANPFEG